MLHSPKLSPERILAYGTTGTSKTHSWLNIARWSQRTHSDAIFYVLDSDNSVLTHLEEDYTELTNVQVFPVYDYPDYWDALDKVYQQVRPQDWIVVDFVGTLWAACQRHFTEEIYGKDVTSFFMEARKEMQKYNDSRSRGDKEQKANNPLDGRNDWGTINRLNDRFTQLLCLRQKCHIFATSKADALQADAPKENLDIYQRWGFKPEGQKFIGHNFRTILLLQKEGHNYRINSVKDKGRTLLEGEIVKDFTITYLKNVAGWIL